MAEQVSRVAVDGAVQDEVGIGLGLSRYPSDQLVLVENLLVYDGSILRGDGVVLDDEVRAVGNLRWQRDGYLVEPGGRSEVLSRMEWH